MKILFIGSTRRTALALHYFTNMVRMGYKVLPYDPDYFFARQILERLSIRMTRKPSPGRRKLIFENLVSLCQRNRFDSVMVLAENFVDVELLTAMRNCTPRPPLFIYHSHDNNFAPGILKPANFFETLKLYDVVFTTKSQNVEPYKKLGQLNTHFIPSAYEPTIHHPIENEYSVFGDSKFDVSFVGTFDESRIRYIQAAGWQRTHVWGDRWRRYKGYSRHKENIHARAIYDFEFADVTSHSRCALGLLREEAGDLHTTRSFEIPACGTLQFAPRNPEIGTFFKDNEEIVLFDSLEELKEKLDYYLTHEWQRQQLARRGYERCLRDKHTYLDRVQEIYRIVKGKLSSRVALPQEAPPLQSPALAR